MAPTDARCRVLLAEDNPVNVELVKAILAVVDCDVTVAEDGLEAVEAFKARRFELVLLDFHMPGMNGSTVAKAIRAIEAGREGLPAWIAALTASAMPEDHERCIEAGMNEVLAKPIDVLRLRHLVGLLCERSKHNSPHWM